jgi:predicted dithiol-disulfide oxidoreductase (DUF899 family)
MPAMSPRLRHLSFPGESMEYRAARNALLVEEIELRRQIERVANQRRALPTGGIIPEDYQFDGNGGAVKLSALFAPGKDTLAIYSFMYGSDRERPCPGCTHFLDGLDGEAEHIIQRINLAVVAKSPLPRILDFAKERGWRRLHLLSTVGNTYDRDYFGDSTGLSAAVREQQDFKAGQEWDMPMLNVFCHDGREIRHFWGSEVLYVPPEPGQEYRHNDALRSGLAPRIDAALVGRRVQAEGSVTVAMAMVRLVATVTSAATAPTRRMSQNSVRRNPLPRRENRTTLRPDHR